MIPANVLLGLLSAFFWGGGDFSGGMGAKYAGGGLRGALRTILVSHSTSLVLLLAIAGFRADAVPSGYPAIWAAGAGVMGGLSIACFYIALARGAMGPSAAISGLLAAAIPALVSFWSESSPGASRLFGFVVAGLAIWLVAAGSADTQRPQAASTTGLAVLAGAGFGIYFVALKMAGAGGVVWPLAISRMSSLTTCALVLLAIPRGSALTGESLSRKAVAWCLGASLLDTSGNLLFISATRAGRLDVAAVLASFYPATTIVLANLMLKERMNRRQTIGLVLAALAVAMITL